ncbi:UDP-N-acetylmuramate--L-alanine ligase [Limisalsivibrio acetivorans]|uniref:UDP-N-acetylmuramate--L-alanine ligase n=1 Tax=Limisalsivibrio acetivorans TaxID=1304888 RepID=UPI000478A197
MFGKVRNIHFVGIGGIGMSGIAEVLKSIGYHVTGSDIAEGGNVLRLRDLGIDVFVGHRAENAEGAHVVVYSSAVKEDNPELVYARDNYIPVIKRGEMLAELMRMKFSIAVSGSHGKTTTTSMVAEIFNRAELDPTIIVGGILNRGDSNAAFGKGHIVIAEADESDRSFLMMAPSIAIITNIDYEHPDAYSSLDDVKNAFVDFAAKIPFFGLAVVCVDDDNTVDIIPRLEKRFLTYGIKAQADVRGENIRKDGFSISFDVVIKGEKKGRVKLGFPGEHNVLNALAAIAVASEFDVPFRVAKAALEEFSGVQRRLTVRFDDGCCTVMDDYGHHPTEIRTTLRAVHEAYGDRKIVAVFQPHRYSRTAALMKDFTSCFMDADELFVTDIYAASEEPIEGVTSEEMVKGIKEHGFKNAHYISEFEDVYKYFEENGCEDTVILTLGAGSITRFSIELSAMVERKRSVR